MNNETEVNPFKKIVQDVKDGIIGDNGAIYNEEVCERVRVQIIVNVIDKRFAPCIGFLNDWREELKEGVE